ncbi:MAG: DUF721 domain-containing protein [Syntrophaceae bacterium]|nr:DUF721 domain-containing protein [Syntrophaceae bacterium]
MARRAGQKQLLKIGDIIAPVLLKKGIRLPADGRRLKSVWDQTVGPMIAAQTAPGKIKDGTIFVRVSNSVWMHQLQFLKHDIVEKFRTVWTGEPVDRLHFSIGKVAAVSSVEKEKEFFHPTASLLKKRDKLLIEESLERVKDPELQAILRRVMIKELCRRRYLEHHRRVP